MVAQSTVLHFYFTYSFGNIWNLGFYMDVKSIYV